MTNLDKLLSSAAEDPVHWAYLSWCAIAVKMENASDCGVCGWPLVQGSDVEAPVCDCRAPVRPCEVV